MDFECEPFAALNEVFVILVGRESDGAKKNEQKLKENKGTEK